MAWPPRVVAALSATFGPSTGVHTAFPPFSVGGELVDVSEHPQPDGSVVYATAGLSEGGGYSALEMILHAVAPDPRLPELLARIGGSSRDRRYVNGGTLPLAGPEATAVPFDGVGFLYAGRDLVIDTTRIFLQQVFGLTSEELKAARTDGLFTVEAAFWRDGVGLRSQPGRPTSPSLSALLPARPSKEALVGLRSPEAWDLIDAVVRCDHDEVEGLRMQFPLEEARILARALGERLPHPSQLACLLHGLMDFPVAELALPALRILQLRPEHPMASQYYADALAMLAAIEGRDHTEAYDRYSDDFDAAKVSAAERRAAAGLALLYG